MQITALAPWFGAKRNLAKEICVELGPHRTYWEPFCGSMAVLMNKPESTTETVCDLHGDLTNLAWTLQDMKEGARLFRRLRRVLMSESEHQRASEEMEKPFEQTPERAYWYFIQSWQSRNGVAGTSRSNATFARRFTSKGGQGGKRFHSAIDSIPAWRRRLRNVNVLRTNAFDIIPQIEDDFDTAIYLDPPYLVKGAKYAHDFEPVDHQRLAAALRRFEKTRVVVSYYEHQDLKALYPGWTQRKIEVSKALAHQGSRGECDTKATEVLIVNGKSYAAKNGTLFVE